MYGAGPRGKYNGKCALRMKDANHIRKLERVSATICDTAKSQEYAYSDSNPWDHPKLQQYSYNNAHILTEFSARLFHSEEQQCVSPIVVFPSAKLTTVCFSPGVCVAIEKKRNPQCQSHSHVWLQVC